MIANNVFILNCNWLISKEVQNFLKQEGCKIQMSRGIFDLQKMLHTVKPDLFIIEIFSLTPDLIELIDTIEKMEKHFRLVSIKINKLIYDLY